MRLQHFVLIATLIAVPRPAVAQVAIDRVPAIAQLVHNAERMNFGADSSREERNRNWARIVGIIRFGHPAFNPTPDPGWCIKDGGGGRPQSDDVIVQCQSREFWDCIPGAGANGYRFECSFDGILPPEQNVYAPPVPSGGGGVTPVPPTSSRWTAAHSDIVGRLGRPASGLSDPGFVQRVAEQLGHSFPGETWGMKRAAAGRPISGDVVARQADRLLGYRIIPATTAPVELDITGQHFVAIAPRDHLGAGPVVPPPVDPGPPPAPPAPAVSPAAFEAALAALVDLTRHLDGLTLVVAAYEARLAALETAPPAAPPPFPCSTGHVWGKKIRVCPEVR